MEFVAQEFSKSLHLTAPPDPAPLRILDKEISGLGDIAVMLRLPKTQRLFPRQTVTMFMAGFAAAVR